VNALKIVGNLSVLDILTIPEIGGISFSYKAHFLAREGI